jgi:hypothetical protein
MRDFRARLVEHVGGKPSATQAALIDRATWLALHVAQLDRRTADSRAMTEHDSRTYLAWSNSLTRTLRELGMEGAATPAPPDLRAHLAKRGQAAPAAERAA